jgi:hypothetical protein
MSPADNERFRALVARQVSVGMPLVAAEYHLGKLGFACDDGVAAPAISCSRLKDNVLLYSCVQEVTLETDAAARTVAAVVPQPIRCVGL